MKRILIVKVTSLGDIVQAQPVVSDLQRAFPGVKVDWAADDAFAEIVRWNTCVDRALYAPLRRFKRARRFSDLRAIASSIAELRRERYDAVIDIHGVYKSAIISFLARGQRRYGYVSQDLGERGAAFAYTDRFRRPPDVNAWQGMRLTLSEAFGYQIVEKPHYGLRVPAPATRVFDAGLRVAMLFHATSAMEKKWPIERWVAVGNELVARGYHIVLPWGSDGEHADAVAIAAGVRHAEVLPRLTVTECAQRIEAASLVVGTDTGLVHLACALERPTVMIFAATSRSHFGIDYPGRAVSVGEAGHPPSIDAVLQAIDSVEPRLAAGQNTLMSA
jgi:heptosyltransferase-1